MDKKPDESNDPEDDAGEDEATVEVLYEDENYRLPMSIYLDICPCPYYFAFPCNNVYVIHPDVLAEDKYQVEDGYTTYKNNDERSDEATLHFNMNWSKAFLFEKNANEMVFQEPYLVLDYYLPDLDPEKGTRPRHGFPLPKLSTVVDKSNWLKPVPTSNVITGGNKRVKDEVSERNYIHIYAYLILRRIQEIAKCGIDQNEENKLILSETARPFNADDEYEIESISDSGRSSIDTMEGDIYVLKDFSFCKNECTDANDTHEHERIEAENRSQVGYIKRTIKRTLNLDTSLSNMGYLCESTGQIDSANNLDSDRKNYDQTISRQSEKDDEMGSSEMLTNTLGRSSGVSDKISEKTRCKGKPFYMIVSEETDHYIESEEDVKRLHIDHVVSSASHLHQRGRPISNNDLVKPKQEDDAEDDCHMLRQITWLPSDQLPVPDISTCITVNSAAQVILNRIASGEHVRAQESMKFEILRVCTFRNYPNEDKPFRILFSSTGMYYASDGDEVVCYSCGLRKSGWKETDSPRDVHQKIKPNCEFLVNNNAVNIPVPELESSQLVKFKALDDLLTSNERTSTEQNETTSGSYGNFDLNTSESPQYRFFTPPPKHPQYAVQSVRLETFKGWPTNIPQTPQIMAECGYYYAGFGDCVRCFHCGIGLRHWTEEDYPWIEHARWSKDCAYLRQMKGEEFIQNVHLAIDQDEEPEDLIPATASGQPADMSQVTPNEDSNQILLTDPAQSVLEIGYQPRTIKKAIDIILRSEGRSGISAEKIMETIFMLEERSDNLEQGVANVTISGASSEMEIQSQNSSERSQMQNNRVTDEQAQRSSTGQSQTNAGSGQNSSSSQTQGKTAKGQGSDRNADCTQRSMEVKPQVQKGTHVKSEDKAHAKSDPKIPSKRVTKNEDAASPKSSPHSSLEEKAKGATGTSHASRDTSKIKAENQKLKEQTICKVCLDKPVSIVFLPCGHLVTCAECAPAMKKCPICRGMVKGMVKAFMS